MMMKLKLCYIMDNRVLDWVVPAVDEVEHVVILINYWNHLVTGNRVKMMEEQSKSMNSYFRRILKSCYGSGAMTGPLYVKAHYFPRKGPGNHVGIGVPYGWRVGRWRYKRCFWVGNNVLGGNFIMHVCRLLCENFA